MKKAEQRFRALCRCVSASPPLRRLDEEAIAQAVCSNNFFAFFALFPYTSVRPMKYLG